MKRWLVVLLALLASLVSSQRARANTPESQDVWLLEPIDYPDRWLEAEHRLVAELETAGFRVVRRQVTAPDQETLMRTLVNSAPVFASFIMLREGNGGAAFVWLAGAARIKRFAMSDVSSSRAAGAIALRVTEYLNMQVLTISVPPPPPTPEPARPQPATLPPRKKPPPEPVEPARPAPRWLLWLGPSAAFSSAAENAALGVALAGGATLSNMLALEGNLDVWPSALVVDSDFGRTKVTGASVRLFASFEPRLSPQFWLALGLGAGVLRVNADSEGVEGVQGQPDSATSSVFAARGRLRFTSTNGFTLLASLEPGLSVPAIRVQADGEDAARLGRPWILATLGAGWSF